MRNQSFKRLKFNVFKISITLVLLTALTGCISIMAGFYNPGSPDATVTVSGQVSPSYLEGSAQAMEQTHLTSYSLVAEIPVHLFRVSSNGDLALLKTGMTDTEGRFTFTGVPDQTHILVQATIPVQNQAGTTQNLELRATSVTDGDTVLFIDPAYHMAYEFYNYMFEEILYRYMQEFTPEQTRDFISLLTHILFSDIVPQIGPPQLVSDWFNLEPCEGNPGGPTIPMDMPPYVRCYLSEILSHVDTNEAIEAQILTTMVSYIPMKTLQKVDSPIPTDASLQGWEGIAPITTKRSDSWDEIFPMQNVRPYTDFRHLYLARDTDGENFYILIIFDTPTIESTGAYMDLVFESSLYPYSPDSDYFMLNINESESYGREIYVASSIHDSHRLDEELIGIAFDGRFVEFKIPYSVIADIFGTDPFMVSTWSAVSHDSECVPGQEPICSIKERIHALPYVTVEHH